MFLLCILALVDYRETKYNVMSSSWTWLSSLVKEIIQNSDTRRDCFSYCSLTSQIVCLPPIQSFCMEMRRLTGDESALWFVWQKQESNNWSFTASELACLFCFIEHVKAQGSQNITIYHPSKNMPSWQKNQNTTYYKYSKLSLDEWRMQKQKCAHQVPTLFWNWATTIYT